VHDADYPAFDQDWNSQHRADSLLPQDRVHDLGMLKVDDDRPHFGGDSPCEAARERHLDALTDLLLQPSCGAGDENAAVLVQK